MNLKLPTLRTSLKPRSTCQRLPLIVSTLLLVVATIWFPPAVAAQEQEQEPQPSSVIGILKKVGFDPTTYAPALISYDATLRDWKSSQVFFANGFREWNERFTVTGLPNDVPVSYSVGRRRILKDALVTMQISAANSLATHAVEALLVERYAKHRRLIKALALVDRVVIASYMSHRLSATHYQQARHNDALARSLGYR